jgi:hypothetical protein
MLSVPSSSPFTSSPKPNFVNKALSPSRRACSWWASSAVDVEGLKSRLVSHGGVEEGLTGRKLRTRVSVRVQDSIDLPKAPGPLFLGALGHSQHIISANVSQSRVPP